MFDGEPRWGCRGPRHSRRDRPSVGISAAAEIGPLLRPLSRSAHAAAWLATTGPLQSFTVRRLAAVIRRRRQSGAQGLSVPHLSCVGPLLPPPPPLRPRVVSGVPDGPSAELCARAEPWQLWSSLSSLIRRLVRLSSSSRLSQSGPLFRLRAARFVVP